jgi:hypothetical protein
MNNPPAESRVTTFLKGTLKNAAVSVPKLEVMARAAGLLGEHQRIANAKPFRRAKSALGIQSVRKGGGCNETESLQPGRFAKFAGLGGMVACVGPCRLERIGPP